MTDSLSIRIERLERENRRIRRLATLACLGLVWPLVLGARPEAPKTIELQSLLVRDAKGAPRIELGTQPDGSALIRLLDGRGTAGVILRGAPAGPILELADGQGGSAWLSSSTTGASLSLSKNKAEIELATVASGYPKARMQDKDGKVVWNVPE